MRLPLVTDISSRDGSSTKNARMKNVLQHKKPTGQIMAVVRPGLTVAGTASGDGMGVYCWQREGSNSLIGIYDDVVYVYSGGAWVWVWGSTTTYTYGSSVYYEGTVYYSYSDTNLGNTPGVGSIPYWQTTAPNQNYTIANLSVVLTSGLGLNSTYTATWDIKLGAVTVGSGSATYVTSLDVPSNIATSTTSNWPRQAGGKPGHDIGLYLTRPTPPPETVFYGTTQWSGNIGWVNFAWSPSQSSGTWLLM